MPSKTRRLLCTLMKTRTEGPRSEFPEKMIPEKKPDYMAVYANRVKQKNKIHPHSRQRWKR